MRQIVVDITAHKYISAIIDRIVVHNILVGGARGVDTGDGRRDCLFPVYDADGRGAVAHQLAHTLGRYDSGLVDFCEHFGDVVCVVVGHFLEHSLFVVGPEEAHFDLRRLHVDAVERLESFHRAISLHSDCSFAFVDREVVVGD